MKQKSFFSHYIIPLFLFFLCSCGNNTSQAPAEIKPKGQSLYEANCTTCHGEDGKLGVLGAKDLSISTLSKSAMIDVITNGKSTMTPFASVMNPVEIDSVASYVLTLKK